jgi:hypothetical protein
MLDRYQGFCPVKIERGQPPDSRTNDLTSKAWLASLERTTMSKTLIFSRFAGGALGAALTLTACAQGTVILEAGGASGARGAAGTLIGGSDSGGSNAGTAGNTATAGASGASTTSGPCVYAEDCVAFSDACNVGACINSECGKLPAKDGSPCEDGKMCTALDTCLDGVCKGGPMKSCPSNGPCSVGICDVATDTCIEVPGNDGGFCNMGDPCVLLSSCLNGVCQPNQLKDCSFMSSVCGDGVCDPQKGCISVPKNEGTPCNDFQFCTIQDQCTGGVCAGVPNPCGVQVDDPCKTGSCNEAQQSCVVVAGNDGAACEDGNQCTGGEKCLAGTCVGGTPANNGLSCDDADGCTSGTSCTNGSCGNPQSQIVTCVEGDMCCPAGCANDKDCLYWESGVQNNVPLASLTGWTQCYSGTYDSFTPMSQLLQQCDKAKLLLACRATGQSDLQVVAMAPRADVLFDCSSISSCTHDANGVGWYYSDSYSWGFAPAGSPVNRNSCDIIDSQTYPGGASDGDQRICWHTGGGSISSGWRCGKPDFIGSTYERLVFEAD